MRRTLALLALLSTTAAQAATVTVYNTLLDWEAAVTGSVQTQDFSGFSSGDSLIGVTLLPGLTLSTNMDELEVFGADRIAFGIGGRSEGDAFYEGQFALPYRAFALDITSFESIPGESSTAVDTGLLSFLFSDGSMRDLAVAGGDGSPIFIGVIADMAISSVRWAEAREGSGANEETGLDNLRVAMRGDGGTVPLPGTLPLAVLALAALPLLRRRR